MESLLLNTGRIFCYFLLFFFFFWWNAQCMDTYTKHLSFISIINIFSITFLSVDIQYTAFSNTINQALVCSVCQFLWYKYHEQFQTTNLMSLNRVGKSWQYHTILNREMIREWWCFNICNLKEFNWYIIDLCIY